jgi:hypothetical protein
MKNKTGGSQHGRTDLQKKEFRQAFITGTAQ